jgi:hypothetical protein
VRLRIGRPLRHHHRPVAADVGGYARGRVKRGRLRRNKVCAPSIGLARRGPGGRAGAAGGATSAVDAATSVACASARAMMTLNVGCLMGIAFFVSIPFYGCNLSASRRCLFPSFCSCRSSR